jgi:hypothetical protein
LFDHSHFDKYSFEKIPLDRDLYLMEEKWMAEYEQALLTLFNGGKYETVGYIAYAAARNISPASAELSWYANVYDRFHELRITLPRDQFVACVGSWQCDEKPRIFVKGAWLENLYLRLHSVFVLIDAIGVKEALRSNSLTREALVRLRQRIDAIAGEHPDVSFISFADSLLLKSNWSVGQFDSAIKYTYAPEVFIRLIAEIQAAYRDILGMRVYAVIAQGSNAFYDDPLLHISETKNHISLNSLGLPFAQLQSIEKAARSAIRDKRDKPAGLYMDETFFRSLHFTYEFERSDRGGCVQSTYREPLMGGEGMYYAADIQLILDNLRQPAP